MELLVLVGLLLVGAFAFAIGRAVWQHNAAGEVRASIARRHEVTPLYVSKDRSSVALDFARGRVVLGAHGFDRVYAFAQIIAAELVEEGLAVSRTNRGSQAARTVLGAAALGGVGALVGGLSASSTTQQRVSRIALNITMRDRLKPLHVITFLDGGASGADPATAATARRKVEEVRARLMNAMAEAGNHPAEVTRDPVQPAAAAAPAGPTAAALAGAGSKKLMLHHLGPNKRAVADVIARLVPEYADHRRSDLVAYNWTPTLLMTGVSEARAQHVMGALAAVGAHASVKQVGFP